MRPRALKLVKPSRNEGHLKTKSRNRPRKTAILRFLATIFFRCLQFSVLFLSYFFHSIMVSFVQLSPGKKCAILELRKAGISQSQIAQQLGVAQSSVSRFLQRQASTGSCERKKGSRGLKKSTVEDDKVLERLSLSDRFKTANELRKEWKDETGVDVSKHMVNRRLLSLNLPARKPRKKPLLNEFQLQRCLDFAQRYCHWTPREWKRVVFIDETWFELFGHQGKFFVRRRKGEEFLPHCMIRTIKHPQKIMCWGGIGPSFKTALVFIDAKKYIHTIGKANLNSFLQKHPHPRPLLMEDGAPCHRARLTKEWNSTRGIRLLEGWPGQSPDLNPIEMKRQILQENPTTIEEVKRICRRVWSKLTTSYLTSLFASMPRRMALHSS